MKTIRQALMLALIGILPALSVAQLDSTCYERMILKGKRAYEKEKPDFKTAINSFIVARYCPDSKKDGEVERLINKALTAWVDTLDTALEEVDSLYKVTKLLLEDTVRFAQELKKQRDTATLNSTLFYGTYVANDARSDLQDSLLLPALMKAFHAYDTLKRTGMPIPPNVYVAFGEAVFYNFGKKLPYRHRSGVIDIGFADTAGCFFSIGRDSALYLWNYQMPGSSSDTLLLPSVQVKRERVVKDREHYILAADFKKNSNNLAFGGRSNRAYILPESSSYTDSLPVRHRAAVVKVKWLPNDMLLTAGRDGKVNLWDENGNFVDTIVEEERGLPFVDLQLSKDGAYALARTMRSIYYWETGRRHRVEALTAVDTMLIYSAALSSNGKMVLASYSNKDVKLWDNAAEVDTFKAGEAALALQFSPDDNYFLIGSSQNGFIQKCHKEANSWKAEVLSPQEGVEQFVFSEHLPYFLTTGSDYSIQIRNANGEVVIIKKHKAPITSLAFSPNERDSAFISSSLDGTVNVWSVEGDLLMEMKLGSAVAKAVFTMDGNYILAATENGELVQVATPRYAYDKLSERKDYRFKKVEKEIKKKIDKLLDK